jgi:hypothetical protein
MAAKRVRISTDNATWYTLPGSQGTFHSMMGQTTDTVFGQNFESKQPDIGSWEVTSDAIFKGVVGYNAVISIPGTPTTMTAEACALVSGKTYQITNAAHRVISFNDSLTVLDNAVDHTANVSTIDYLTGTITFLSAYTPTGPITVTGKYIPLVAVSKAKSFNLTQTSTTIDSTGYDDAQGNSGFKVQSSGLLTVSLTINGIQKIQNGWEALLVARGICYVQIDLDTTNPGVNVFRGFFKLNDRNEAGNVGALETEDIKMDLWVPYSNFLAWPASWYFTGGSTMPVAIQEILTSFYTQTLIYCQYLPTGTVGNTPMDGLTGQGFVSECTLANTVDGLNTFTVHIMGTGTPTAV